MAKGGDPIFQTKRRALKLGTASVNHDQVRGRQLYGLRPASIRQVRKSIKKAKNSTAVDLDDLSPNMLKLCGELLAPLANLITRSFAEGKVPEGWKEARVVPVHKKRTKQDIKNYRPVSILRVGSKIMEDVARGQLSKHFKMHSIIPPEQHDFQKSRSTSTAVKSALFDWRESKSKGEVAGAILFDLSSAFDVVDANILVAKLSLYGLEMTSCLWVRDYMVRRKQQVQVREAL
jgi:hypothetical protein